VISPIIEVENLVKVYPGGTRAVDGISFNVEPGELLGFLGPNGAGKTTTIRILATLLAATSGTARVAGFDVTTQAADVRRRLGLAMQTPTLDAFATGRENIELYGVVLGLRRADIRRRFDAIVQFAELEDHIDTQVRFYSSGMLARLGFAVISQLDPEILIVDEDLAVGDFAFQAKCYEVIDRFHVGGGTIVMVSHSANDVIRLCDEAHLIENRRIAASGTPFDVIRRYQPEFAAGSLKKTAITGAAGEIR